MIADLINGGFELLGGLFILNHCRVLYAQKAVRGVSVLSTAFFTLWGLWNLYFYPSLGQWASFAGGVVIVVANGVWIALALFYARRAQREGRGL